MTTVSNTILNHQEIQHKTKRIAYQIYEANINEPELIIAGIVGSGLLFAKKIKDALEIISEIKVTLCEVSINKKNPLASPITTSIDNSLYSDKPLVLVDDVLNSGRTLIYGVNHFLKVPLKRFNTAVLVNRNHKRYPIKADFKGISLSTSLLEHIVVDFKENNNSVSLT